MGSYTLPHTLKLWIRMRPTWAQSYLVQSSASVTSVTNGDVRKTNGFGPVSE